MRGRGSVSGRKRLGAKMDVIQAAQTVPWMPGSEGSDVAVRCGALEPLGAGVAAPCRRGGSAATAPRWGTHGTRISSETTVQIRRSPRRRWAS